MRLDAASGFAAPQASTPPGQRIALARDAAFSFIYPHMLEAWRAAGAEIHAVLAAGRRRPRRRRRRLLAAGRLSRIACGRVFRPTSDFNARLRAFAETRPVHGECGGYMVLGNGADRCRRVTRTRWRDCSDWRQALPSGACISATGLRELAAPIPGYQAGARLRGHEFHYSTIVVAARCFAGGGARCCRHHDCGDRLAARLRHRHILSPHCGGQVSGFVSFVSAGPGDPELLTLKAVSRLSTADVVLYDDLASGANPRSCPRRRQSGRGRQARGPPFDQAAACQPAADRTTPPRARASYA